jgi:HPt (histidine-containing phosphotransfer) domain-containing protein
LHVLEEIRSLDRHGALLLQVCEIFRTDGARLLGELRTARDAGNRDAFVFAAHTLKSCAGSVGASHVASACESLEHGAREDGSLGPAAALRELEEHYREASAALIALCTPAHAHPNEDSA